MEVDHDPGVQPETFHRPRVRAGGTSGTPKQVDHACTRSDFGTVHHGLYVMQGSALCRGQAVKIGIVWCHVDCSGPPR